MESPAVLGELGTVTVDGTPLNGLSCDLKGPL